MPFINRCGGGGSAKLQSKTVKSTTSQQTVSPDSGYDGFSSVTVSPIKLQAKSVSPRTTSAKVFPDASYDGLSQVTVNKMDLVSKTVTPTKEKQTVLPGAGYDGLSSVDVNAAPLETKNITDNGTFTPSGSNIGFSSVEVNIPRGILGQATNSASSGKSLTFNLGYGISSEQLNKFVLPTDAPIQFIVEIAPTDADGSITKKYGLIHAAFSRISSSGGITRYSCSCYTELGYAMTINKVTAAYNSTNKTIGITLPNSSDWTINPGNESSSSGSMTGQDAETNATVFDDVVFNGTTNYPAVYYMAAFWQ